jgi:hypothetical protein
VGSLSFWRTIPCLLPPARERVEVGGTTLFLRHEEVGVMVANPFILLERIEAWVTDPAPHVFRFASPFASFLAGKPATWRALHFSVDGA